MTDFRCKDCRQYAPKMVVIPTRGLPEIGVVPRCRKLTDGRHWIELSLEFAKECDYGLVDQMGRTVHVVARRA